MNRSPSHTGSPIVPSEMTPTELLWMTGLSAFAGGVSAGALIVWFWSRAVLRREGDRFEAERIRMETEADHLEDRLHRSESDAASARSETVRLKVALAESNSQREGFRRRLDEVLPALDRMQAEAGDLRVTISRMEAARSADAEKIDWLKSARDGMKDTFDALAHQSLRRQSDAFLKAADEKVNRTLSHLVDPMRENLSALERHVRELEGKREGAYQGLTEQIQGLSRTHSELQRTTLTLTEALKSPTVRGRWGEMQLRRVVEMAGMISHVAFEEQVALNNGGRPDMIVHLPNAGLLPVDAKVPLAAYMEAMESKDAETRRTRLDGHAKAVRNRIRELSGKKYWAQFAEAPEFVVMFLPNDACLGAAFEQDPDLLEYAVGLQVLPTTPVTLLAMLKAVAYGWQQHRITENTRQIAAQGQALYDRLETFLAHLADLGKQLDRAVEGYNRTLGSFERRLMPVARRFQEMEIVEGRSDPPAAIEIRAKQPAAPAATDTAPGAEPGA